MASTQLINIALPSQELYLQKIGTRVKVWLEGNQHSAYTVNGAFLVQGSVSVAVTVNGHSSFQVPALGRWSDATSTTRFTLPGTVYLNFVVRGEMPIIDSSALASGSGATIPPEWKPQAVSGVEYNAVTNSLVANYYASFNPSPYSAQYYMNTSISGGASVQILEAMTSYITTSGATCSQTLNTLSSTVTLNETYEEPYELQYFALRYYVSEIVEGTATVCIDAVDCHAWTGTFWANAKHLAAKFAYLYNSWTAENFAMSVGAKCYVTLTEEQVASQIALWEESSPLEVSNAPTMVTGFLLPFFILRAVFDDPSTVEGTYDSPVLVKTTEVTSMETITVSDNSQIAAGDTLTNNVGGIPFVYTFRNLPTGAANEIIIGGTAAITAANIATALNATDGAIFTATSTNGVVSVTEYTSETVTKSTTSAGLTISPVTQTVLRTSPDEQATFPAFTAYAEGATFGALGETYMLSSFPVTSATGASSQSGVAGNVIMPAFTAQGTSFITGKSSASTDAEKISLLLYGSDYMASIASLIAVPGNADDIALLMTQFVANYITYTSDLIVWGVADNWMDASATLYYGFGDCEDMSFLVASLMINFGVNPERVRVYIGENLGVGHAWVEYCRESDNQWVILDATYGGDHWAEISSVNELNEHQTAVASQWDRGEGEGTASDAWEYGSALEYINYYSVIPLSGSQYLLSLTPLVATVMQGDIPPLELSCSLGSQTESNIPAISIAASSTGDTGGTFIKDIPSITLSANSFEESHSSMNATLPIITLIASGEIIPCSTMSGSIGAVTLSADCFGGFYGSLDQAIGGLTLSASSYGSATCSVVQNIPAVTLDAMVRVLAADIFALAVNAKNFGLTKYTNYDYNSMCVFNGHVIGLKRTGLYELEGNNDDDVAIPWKMRTGAIDIGPGRLDFVRIFGKLSGSVTMALELPDGTRYEYPVPPASEYEDYVRVKVGKGLRVKNFGSKYLILELQDDSGEAMTIDKIEGCGMKR